ncbi:MAG: 3-hydroxyacyl-CoA dehydrogenase NAD-binding domain-containing protein [Thermoanaerobaculia bacterium]
MVTVETASPPAAGTLTIEDGVAWLTLDDPDKRVNTLSSRTFSWFEEQVARLEGDGPEEGRIRGLVILSGKPGTFVAGADIEELEGLEDEGEILELLRHGHDLMGRLAALPFPTVAAIEGACLGGGLELALACDFRVAADSKATRLGLPEVQLGLIPGLGGTQRLPRLIGVPDALDLILTGKRLDAKRARRRGLVGATCHPADLRGAALRLIGDGAPKNARKKPLPKKGADWAARLPGASKLVYGRAREQVMERTGGHYPAPLVALEVVRDGMKLPLGRALDLEAGAFARLVASDVAKSLMGIFFMKNDVEGRARALAKKARPVERVGVLGAGLMGAGIAQGLARSSGRGGRQVVMKDRDQASLARGMRSAAEVFDGRVRRRRMTEVEKKEAMARIHPTTSDEPFRRVDFVVEAVFEDLEVKHQVIREIEAVAPEGLIFASNTSTIPIARLAEASKRPERVVGMHFFSPVHKMPLLEVIRHPGTSEEALATTVALGVEMGKTVIVVDDGPGFFTSRVLGPFVNEAAWILTQGARIEEIDRAMRDWGWPVGPLALLDEVGLDVAYHAGRVMAPYFGDRVAAPPAFEAMMEAGRKGRKAGKGFYDYSGKDKGKDKRPDPAVYDLLDWSPSPVPAEEIVERCWLQMLNETARSMEDGVIENPTDVDIGVVFGLGFPPFRGGILREADRQGLDSVVRKLEGYAERYGQRLAPAELLRTMAAEGRTFHGGD